MLIETRIGLQNYSYKRIDATLLSQQQVDHGDDSMAALAVVAVVVDMIW
jgi:hypothetical protein